MFVIRPIGKQALPTLKSGPATITITASRPVLYGIRDRGEPRHPGSRGAPRAAARRRAVAASLRQSRRSGVRRVSRHARRCVGGRPGRARSSYPAFPGPSAGIADPAVRVAFFVLGYDQDRKAPISVFARDAAGNEATSALERRVVSQAVRQVAHRRRMTASSSASCRRSRRTHPRCRHRYQRSA